MNADLTDPSPSLSDDHRNSSCGHQFGIQFSQRPGELVVARRAIVPKYFAFHEANAFTFNGVGDEGCRLARLDWDFAQDLPEPGNVMAVDFHSTPSKCPELLGKRLQSQRVLH